MIPFRASSLRSMMPFKVSSFLSRRALQPLKQESLTVARQAGIKKDLREKQSEKTSFVSLWTLVCLMLKCRRLPQ